MIKVSEYITNFFSAQGVDKCFVVTGGGAMHLNDSLGHSTTIDCIYNHHEQACAMAAEGYTRVSGKPALVCVTSGPGSTNVVTGVLGAWLDSIPMIVLSGQMTFNTTIKSTPIPLRQLGFQEFNIVDSVDSMTKYAVMLTDPKYIAYHLEKAYYLATSGRRGPVWLDIPLDVQSAMVDENELIHYNIASEQLQTTQKTIDSATLGHIMDKLNNAKKPVILAGYGVRMSDSYDTFLQVVDKLKIPVVTEWNSNDLIWKDHEYYAGHPGTIGDRGGNFVLQNADLVLAIGCQFSIRQISYAWKNFAKNAYKIAVDIDRSEMIKPTIKIDYPIHMDVKSFLTNVNEYDKASTHNPNNKWHKWCKNINNKYPVVLDDHFKSISPISIYAFVKSLSDCLDHKDVVTLANGAACVVGLQALEIKQNQRVFTNAGASSMGYGIAAAIGASYARDNNRVVCIEGDGSIQMNLQELQTIIHNNLNIKIFWINNDGYHSIKQTQTSLFNAEKKGFCGANGNSGISFPSAEKIANAYGFAFFKIDNVADLDSIISQTCETPGPVICEVVTNPGEQFQPKLQSKLLEDGTFQTPSLEDMYPFLPKEELKENTYNN